MSSTSSEQSPFFANPICCLEAGHDATEAFFSLHRHEILEKPNYARLQIGVISGESPKIVKRGSGELSSVPYGEPTWLSSGFSSPYYNEVSRSRVSDPSTVAETMVAQSHKKFQAAMRKFVDEIVYPDAQAREEDGKRPSQSVVDAMAAINLHAMRLGPGKHLKGKTLFNGLVSPEEVRILDMSDLLTEMTCVRSLTTSTR